jgi:hypothetical protein
MGNGPTDKHLKLAWPMGVLRSARALVYRHLRREQLSQVAVFCLALALPLLLLPFASSGSQDSRWELVTSYPGDALIRSIAIAPRDGAALIVVCGVTSGLFVSVDGGQQWVRAISGLPQSQLGQVRVIDFALDPQDPSVMYAVVESPQSAPRPMLYWTASGGLTWRPRASLGRERISAVAFGPTSEHLFVATGDEVLKAFVFQPAVQTLTAQERFQRGGDDLHWSAVGSFRSGDSVTVLEIVDRYAEPEARNPGDTQGIQATSTPVELGPLSVYVGSEGGGLRVFGDAASSEPMDADTQYVLHAATVRAICHHPLVPERLFIATDRGIYTSEDGGKTYYRTAHALASERVLALIADPLTATTVYAGIAAGGIMVSHDAGATWARLGIGLERATVISLAIDEQSPRTLYAGSTTGLWRLSLTVVEPGA